MPFDTYYDQKHCPFSAAKRLLTNTTIRSLVPSLLQNALKLSNAAAGTHQLVLACTHAV